MRECLEDERLWRLFRGGLSAEQVMRFERHLDLCSDCQEFVEDVAQSDTGTAPARSRRDDTADARRHAGPSPATAEDLSVSEQALGRRYRPLSHIGEGGMGQVFRVLDRLSGAEVALKRMALHPSSPSPDLSSLAERTGTASHTLSAAGSRLLLDRSLPLVRSFRAARFFSTESEARAWIDEFRKSGQRLPAR